MAEKRKGKKRKEDSKDDADKPSKDEYSIAKWIRKNVPTKKTKFLNHNVEYFTASKAVDGLLTSQWGQAKGDAEPMFPTRQAIVDYLDIMLRHKFFHRAKKIPVSEKELKSKKKKKDDEKKKKDDAESSQAEGDRKEGEDQKDETGKKKRKIRLDMHLDQVFIDGTDAYVWIYDPIPIYYWFFGSLLVIGAIAVCLFPLWPPSVRKGVYYLSIAAAGFLVFIIGLAVLRLVVFCLVWAATFGKHHLWLFPNLTEDVGFFASFWPLWQYEYKGDKKSKKKKEKDSDNEEEDDRENEKEIEKETEKDDNTEKEDNKETDNDRTTADEEPSDKEASDKEQEKTESESEGSQKSQTGKDFEMVDRSEVES